MPSDSLGQQQGVDERQRMLETENEDADRRLEALRRRRDELQGREPEGIPQAEPDSSSVERERSSGGD